MISQKYKLLLNAWPKMQTTHTSTSHMHSHT